MSDDTNAADRAFMRRAVELSRANIGDGLGGPFAAVVVMDGKIVGEGCNHVARSNDPTAHAEISAIRDACKRLGTFSLSGAVMYATCEPCPMCLAAIYWSRISKVYFANTTEEAAAIGFDDAVLYEQLALPAEERALEIVPLRFDEARDVFEEWNALPKKVRY